jgi:hypothetical protein
MTKEEIQAKIDDLTYDLKTMPSASGDNRYAQVWDERAALKAQLYILEKEE